MPKNKNNVPAYVAGTLANNATICRQFARILGGEVMHSSDDSCGVHRLRPELAPTILGRPSKAMAMFHYQSPDISGLTLNTGEVPVLQREVAPFVSSLLADGIIVAGIHAHWLFARPRLIHVHFENVGDPLAFAQAVADAFTVLTGRGDGDDD